MTHKMIEMKPTKYTILDQIAFCFHILKVSDYLTQNYFCINNELITSFNMKDQLKSIYFQNSKFFRKATAFILRKLHVEGGQSMWLPLKHYSKYKKLLNLTPLQPIQK